MVNTIDPITRQITINPAAGILPPNLKKPEGEGSFGFIINKKDGLPDSTKILNKATIVFDFNDPILTPSWHSITDDTRPQSIIQPLKPMQKDTGFTLRWSGSDNLSGVQSYDIFVSKNNATYQLWNRFGAKTDTARFRGEKGIFYRFYSVAIDSAGNIELPPLTPDAQISIEGTISTTDFVQSQSWLGQNRPNPFNYSTEIDYYLDQPSNEVNLTIFDLVGRQILALHQKEVSEGLHTFILTADKLHSGVYLYQLTTQKGLRLSRKMILVE